MLIQFSVENFKTFKEKATMSLIASNYDSTTREEENIIYDEKYKLRLLKSAAIYGANASGKTKLIHALAFMQNFVISSSKDSQMSEDIDTEAFRLSTETENNPSEFEIIFIYKNDLYRYGFEVDKKRVIAEWLYHRPKTKEIEIFYRDEQEFEVHRDFSKGAMLAKEKFVRENALMLSVAAQFNDDLAGNVLKWFQELGIISGIYDEGYRGVTIDKVFEKEDKKKILDLLKAADLGIHNIKINKHAVDSDELNSLPKVIRELLKEKFRESKDFVSFDLVAIHLKYDENHKASGEVAFSIDEEESHGTQKFFYLTGPILDTLERGDILVVDEFDSRLHPNLVNKIISLFNSKELNPNGAQFIFNTHNTRILNSDLLRRDQIWFVEKDRYGAASLFSLSDFKSDKVRKNDNYEEKYIRGEYGAIPYLQRFSKKVKSGMEKYNENEK